MSICAENGIEIDNTKTLKRPLWVKSRHLRRKKQCPLYPNSGHKTAVRDLSKPDACLGVENARSYPDSGHSAVQLACPLWANSGHSGSSTLCLTQPVWPID
jgi:hypothetical protein